jgi:hypothetical protein
MRTCLSAVRAVVYYENKGLTDSRIAPTGAVSVKTYTLAHL